MLTRVQLYILTTFAGFWFAVILGYAKLMLTGRLIPERKRIRYRDCEQFKQHGTIFIRAEFKVIDLLRCIFCSYVWVYFGACN